MAREVTIRSASIADAAALASMAGELGYPVSCGEMNERMERLLSDQRHAVYVAEDRIPVAWIHVSAVLSLEGGTFAEILGLVVSEKSRRSGIGARLVKRAEEWAVTNGCARVRVRMNIARREARMFYLALGYDLRKTQEVYDKSL